MGCCFGKDEYIYQDHNAGENSRLLGDPVRNSSGRTAIGDGYSSVSPHTANRGGDEQSALDRILTQTAVNVIDVTAIDTTIQEQSNYQEITQYYSNCINQGLSGSGRVRNYRPQLPTGVPSPHVTLVAPPISLTDLVMITSAAERAAVCVSEVKVEHREDLVVPFGIP